MEGQHRDFLVFQTVGGHLTAFAIEDEIVGTVPVFDHLQPVMDVASEGVLLEILADYVEFILSRETEKLVCFKPLSHCESETHMLYWSFLFQSVPY
jgi:hypothetical protein